ncbi:NAD(P)/FAD-dependent oxidoreductase [Thioalkalivibrio thiocyanodenitrificans]|uniref:NAD(P)/FAD-dependent oxidoreductase n=1 Tax=Thioalkalivibrio thiocyanodenitrificans TaxID=243063 RepID=UPI00036E1738|nr:FAD-dependent oxidoreductase [Thioalkalivibrio thiocyanodenitrificans]
MSGQGELDTVIIGGGMAGMACAVGMILADRQAVVVEQDIKAGGRMSGLRTQGYEFDAGAQYFTVRDPLFRAQVETWLAEQRVAPWHGWVVEVERGDFFNRDLTELFVAQPSMGALVRHLATHCDVREGTRIATVARSDGLWRLLDERGEEQARCGELVLAMPAPQARSLILAEAPEIAGRIGHFETTACWAVMLGFETALPVPFDAAYVSQSPLGWVARNNSKPGRASREAWVLHATPEWSAVHADLGESEVLVHLLRAMEKALDLEELDPVFTEVRFWPHAAPIHTLGDPFLRDETLGLSLCGDWCLGPRVEAAYLSGHALSECLAG